MTRFPFTDLHSFKDFVVFVKLCAPDEFDEPWTISLAFEGLRLGIEMAVKEKGDLPVFAECRKLIDEAFAAYSADDLREGFFKLDKVRKLLRKVPSW